jgi:hypothetical protein
MNKKLTSALESVNYLIEQMTKCTDLKNARERLKYIYKKNVEHCCNDGNCKDPKVLRECKLIAKQLYYNGYIYQLNKSLTFCKDKESQKVIESEIEKYKKQLNALKSSNLTPK